MLAETVADTDGQTLGILKYKILFDYESLSRLGLLLVLHECCNAVLCFLDTQLISWLVSGVVVTSVMPQFLFFFH